MDSSDLSKYFESSNDEKQSHLVRQSPESSNILNEPKRDTTEQTACKLFQNVPSIPASTANSDAARFFDMIGGDTSGSTNIAGLMKLNDDSPINVVNMFSIPDTKPLPKPGRSSDIERSKDAWIPSESTRRVLISMVTSPSGSFTPDRDSLTMPGVILEEDMKDTVLEAVNHYLGPSEGEKRKVMSASDVTQDDRGLRELMEAGCYRAAVNLTKPLLTIYGQGAGRAGHPSKHTAHSIQLWFTRLSLLVKLRSFVLADVESEPFGDLDKPDLFFQFYPELYGGRMGSMVPFGFRLLLAVIPMYIEKQQICMARLHKILATVRKMLSNLAKGLLEDGTPCDISAVNRDEAIALWSDREKLILYSIVNCAVSLKDFTLAIDVMEMLLARDPPAHEAAAVRSSLGRILLQFGDVASAEKQFENVRQMCDMQNDPRHIVDLALLLVANNKFKEAMDLFEIAVKIEPTNVMILNNMSVCLLYLGRLREAVSLLEKGLQAYPKLALHESYLLNLCNLYELQNTQCSNAKIKLLSLVSRYRGDNINLACLKLN